MARRGLLDSLRRLLQLALAEDALAFESDSPGVQKAAPSNTTSFKRKPPDPESAGKPPRLFSQPGKENRNVNVAKNVQTASTLPIAESLAEMGRIAINSAAVISATPIDVRGTLQAENFVHPAH